jgi:hypothetical protein
VDQLLRGLPRLGHLVLSFTEDGPAAAAPGDQQQQQLVGAAAGAAAAVAQQARPPAAARVVLQHFPSGLTYLQLHLGGIIDLDVAALAACSRLQNLDFWWLHSFEGLINISSLAALTALTQLTLDGDYQRDGMIAAISQLLLLQSLSLLGWLVATADSDNFSWGRLAAMPSLLHLELNSLKLDLLHGAAPLNIASLVVYDQLLGSNDLTTGQVPELQPVCLTALLPELQHMDMDNRSDMPAVCRTYGCHVRIAAALQGHPRLQHLRINSWDAQDTDDEEPVEPCCQQHMRRQLASLQQLRTMKLPLCVCQPVDEMLAVVAGCPQLAGRGLEQLALGACASSLRRVVLSDIFPLSQVARLLDGSCPQLQHLELQVVLEEPPLLGPVHADVVAFQAGAPVGEGLLRSMEGVAQQLQGQLQQLLVSAVELGAVQLQWACFQLMQHWHWPADISAAAPVPVVIEGTVGGSRVQWTAVWEGAIV